MDYSTFVSAIQLVGLLILGASAISVLRLFSMHFCQTPWAETQVRSLFCATSTQSLGLLLLAFSTGAILATRLFETNEFPPVWQMALYFTLLLVIASATVFMHVVVRPWLSEASDVQEPLVATLGIHRIMAVTLAYAGFASALLMWSVSAWPADGTPTVAQTFSAFALTTLLLWSLLAVPAALLRAAFWFTELRPSVRSSAPGAVESMRRALPRMPDLPQPREAHVPAPRAPRPLLLPHENSFTG